VLIASFGAKASFPPDPGWSGVHPPEIFGQVAPSDRFGATPAAQDAAAAAMIGALKFEDGSRPIAEAIAGS